MPLKKDLRRAMRDARHGRDEKGRWTKDHSGNPFGRPVKKPAEPKLLDELIAEKLSERVPVTGANGKVRQISAYEQIIEDLVASLATAKPREKMQILEWMEKRSLFHRMKMMADPDGGNPFEEQHDEWLEQRMHVKEHDHLIRKLLRERRAFSDHPYLDVSGPPLDG